MTATLTDICAAIVDCEHKTAPAGDGFALSVGTRAMRNGRLVLASCKPVSSETYKSWTRRLEPVEGDLILAREAPVGDVVRVPDGLRVCLGQRTVLIRPDTERVDPRFLHYWLLGPIAQTDMHSRAGGATVPHLNVEDIRELDVTALPDDRELQSQAGAILGAIDDLIENNRRRIVLLEQMARAIYREWFVHFRYPGHQDDELVDSPLGPIPAGWRVRAVEELAAVVRGRSYRKHELVEEGGVPFVNLKCMERGGGFRRDGLKRYAGPFKPEQVTSAGDIVLAVTDLTQAREILARATLVPRLSEESGVISLDVVRLVPNSVEDRIPLFAVLRYSDLADRVKEHANGSTVLHLSPDHVAAALIIWPVEPVRRRAADFLGSMYSLCDELSDAADRLASIRDLLLPKVVTGAIDVSSIDLDALVE